MAAISVATVSCAFMLAGTFVRARLGHVLPWQHLNSNTKDIVEPGGLHESTKR